VSEVLKTMRERRVVRSYSDAPVAEETLWKVLEAARWAPAAGNRRLNRFVCIIDTKIIRQLSMISPGMLGSPAAVIIVCIDRREAGNVPVLDLSHTAYIDVGTVMQNMLLAAHALGVGACPVTSFSHAAVKELLNLPDHLEPELFVCLGYPARSEFGPIRPSRPTSTKDLVHWGPFPAPS